METQDKIYQQYQDAARKTENQPFASMDKIWDRIEEKLDEGTAKKIIPFWKISMAAAVLLLLSLGCFYMYRNMQSEAILIEPAIVQKNGRVPHLQQNIRPDTGKNLLTQKAPETSDGKRSNPITIRKAVPGKNTAVVPDRNYRTLKGILSDERGEPLVGASVSIAGTHIATLSDLDGKYELQVARDKKHIEISATGYEKMDIAIKGTDSLLSVNLKASNVLSDVVVTTPYGPRTTREKYVGAADVITAKMLDKTPVSDITSAIEGSAPGIVVANGGGQPGSGAGIQIRGRGSLHSGTAPLIVVDGIIFSGDLTAINPEDVETMAVLKDAASTSLYGARGANGTILITTKKGSAYYVGGRKLSGIKRTFRKIKKLFTKQPAADTTQVRKAPSIENEKTE